MSLLIVESPAKARKIQSYLKHTDIQVLSSFGHITNLDTSKLDDMIQDNFTPLYKPSKDKSKVIRELKQAGKGKDIILAADDDREGDAIAWHCGNLFRLNYQQHNRIIFHEISKKAIETALSNKHKLNMNSVESQRCRQLLDLIIGFKLSPLLWKHIETSQKGLSAGRVQSTLLRMLQEHETEISNFRPETYYDFKGSFQDKHSETTLDAEFEFSDDYYESVDQIDGETYKGDMMNVRGTVQVITPETLQCSLDIESIKLLFPSQKGGGDKDIRHTITKDELIESIVKATKFELKKKNENNQSKEWETNRSL